MKFLPTCSLCVHFEPNTEQCRLLQEPTNGINTKAVQCANDGHFVRDINVLLDSYHQFEIDEKVPSSFRVDISRLSKDKHGRPLFVMTKRGMERAIPAYPELELEGDVLTGVKKIFTYQGQRELIYDLGVEVARDLAKSREVELVVLPGEEHSVGIPEELKRHFVYNNRPRVNPASLWKAKEGEDW